MRNRNGCRIPSQSGLDLKYRADNSRGTKGIVIHSISEELQNTIRHPSPVRPGFRYSPDSNSLIQLIVTSTCV